MDDSTRCAHCDSSLVLNHACALHVVATGALRRRGVGAGATSDAALGAQIGSVRRLVASAQRTVAQRLLDMVPSERAPVAPAPPPPPPALPAPPKRKYESMWAVGKRKQGNDAAAERSARLDSPTRSPLPSEGSTRSAGEPADVPVGESAAAEPSPLDGESAIASAVGVATSPIKTAAGAAAEAASQTDAGRGVVRALTRALGDGTESRAREVEAALHARCGGEDTAYYSKAVRWLRPSPGLWFRAA